MWSTKPSVGSDVAQSSWEPKNQILRNVRWFWTRSASWGVDPDAAGAWLNVAQNSGHDADNLIKPVNKR